MHKQTDSPAHKVCKKSQHYSRVFLSSGRKWQSRHRYKKGQQILQTKDAEKRKLAAAASANRPTCLQNADKPQRLWKNACISTAANVQKPLFCRPKRFCPRSVQLGYNVFPTHPAARKPLSL
jgi:hypothetical protein